MVLSLNADAILQAEGRSSRDQTLMRSLIDAPNVTLEMLATAVVRLDLTLADAGRFTRQ